jgi:type IV pilus assembly protein PilW
MTTRSNFITLHRNFMRGFSLIEMMIAIVIGIILSIGLIQVMVAGKTAAQATQGANFMQENARFAMSELSYSLQMADHWGPSNPDKGQTTAAAPGAFNTIVASCPGLLSTSGTTYVTGQNWWTLGTFGISGTAGDPKLVLGADCLPEWDDKSKSDTIVLRYADSNFIRCTDVACATPDAATPVTPGALYVRTAVSKDMILATGDDITKLAAQNYGSIAPLDAGYYESPDHANQDGLYTFPYRIEIYYVRKCSTPIGGACTAASDNGNPIRTLWRRRIDDSGNFVLEPVVEGIDHLQFEYGLASDNVSSGAIHVRFSDVQTYAPASTVGTGVTSFNWLKVTSVRVGLLAQSDSFNSSGTRTDVGQNALQGKRYLGSDTSPTGAYTPTGASDKATLQYAVFTTSGQLRNRDRG